MRHYEKATNLQLVLTKQLFLLSSVKKSGRFFSKFCGLFRKAGLYAKMFDNENPPIRIENKNPQIKEFNGAEKTLVS